MKSAELYPWATVLYEVLQETKTRLSEVKEQLTEVQRNLTIKSSLGLGKGDLIQEVVLICEIGEGGAANSGTEEPHYYVNLGSGQR